VKRCLFPALFLCAATLFGQTLERAATDMKDNIGVITLSNGSGVAQGEAAIISDRLRVELFKTGRVNVMEREQMRDVLKEQGFQQSGACTDKVCLVEVGQLLGVQYLVTGSLGKLGSLFLVNIRMIDIRTGRFIAVLSRDIDGSIEEVVEHLPGIAAELVKKRTVTTKAKTSPPPAVVETWDDSPLESEPVEESPAAVSAPPPPAPPMVHNAWLRQLAIKIGISISRLHEAGSDYDSFYSSTDPKAGLITGLGLRFKLGRMVSLEPEFLLSMKGTNVTSVYYYGSYEDMTVRLTYLSLPCFVRVSPIRHFRFKPVLGLGLEPALRLGGTLHFDDGSKESYYSGSNFFELAMPLSIGGEGEFKSGTLLAELRFTFGLSLATNSPADSRNRVASFIIGYAFTRK